MRATFGPALDMRSAPPPKPAIPPHITQWLMTRGSAPRVIVGENDESAAPQRWLQVVRDKSYWNSLVDCMKKEINIVILSIITGLLNSFYIGLSLALTSGDPEFTTNEIIGHVCFWSSTVHVLISSWLFIYSKLIGRIVAILTSSIGMIASVMILSDGESLLWFSILIGFVLTILFHAKNLNRIKW